MAYFFIAGGKTAEELKTYLREQKKFDWIKDVIFRVSYPERNGVQIYDAEIIYDKQSDENYYLILNALLEAGLFSSK
jgi:hypothetical protein